MWATIIAIGCVL
ncbi:hypothetical protein SAMN03159443_02030 [Pseudomonas sp. NFACC15-1]|nr:hypothetical protein SAMN03159443_02030 [Pseudomonas sp. NFACC15-1]SDY07233.1 hypothetical protein SAMN03159380_03403 [Pseudomonas sp. NFACC14]